MPISLDSEIKHTFIHKLKTSVKISYAIKFLCVLIDENITRKHLINETEAQSLQKSRYDV